MGLQTETVPSLNGVVRRMVAVVPSDDDDLTNWEDVIGLRITGTGDVKYVQGDGSLITVNVGNYDVLGGAIQRVHATDTTATGIFALYGTRS